jgi:hypothetical protein
VVTIRGRLQVGAGAGADAGAATVAVGQGEVARSFHLVLPDPALGKAARELNGKAVVVTAVWERQAVVVGSRLRKEPTVHVVLVNGVEKAVPLSGKARWEIEKKVVEFFRVKSLVPAPPPANEPARPTEDGRKGKP